MSPPPATSVGARLREAREKRGVPLRQIAERTRISVMALEALERDDPKRLPGGIFTRSFVRAYAAEVGLDPNRMVGDFLNQFPHEGAGATGRPVEDGEAFDNDRRMAHTLVRLAGFSVPIIGLVMYLGIRQPISSGSQPDAQTEAAESDSPRSTTNEGVPSAAATQPQAAGDPATTAEDSGSLVLVMTPRAGCWVSIAIDGGKASSDLLAAGERREIRAEREIELTVGDAGACLYTINGVTGRPLGAAGQVATRRIDRQNYRNFQIDR